MAYRIDPASCTGCGSCEFDCPNGAISAKGDVYVINPKKCTECKGHFDKPQCVSLCPADAISLA
jgi:ferredoxin